MRHLKIAIKYLQSGSNLVVIFISMTEEETKSSIPKEERKVDYKKKYSISEQINVVCFFAMKKW